MSASPRHLRSADDTARPLTEPERPKSRRERATSALNLACDVLTAVDCACAAVIAIGLMAPDLLVWMFYDRYAALAYATIEGSLVLVCLIAFTYMRAVMLGVTKDSPLSHHVLRLFRCE